TTVTRIEEAMPVPACAESVPAATSAGTMGNGTPAWFARTPAKSRENAYTLTVLLGRGPGTARCARVARLANRESARRDGRGALCADDPRCHSRASALLRPERDFPKGRFSALGGGR